jgi:hypothetical protein
LPLALRVQKPFLLGREGAMKVLEFIDTANTIDAKVIYYLFSAYVKQDYFAQKYLEAKATWQDDLKSAYDLALVPRIR